MIQTTLNGFALLVPAEDAAAFKAFGPWRRPHSREELGKALRQLEADERIGLWRPTLETHYVGPFPGARKRRGWRWCSVGQRHHLDYFDPPEGVTYLQALEIPKPPRPTTAAERAAMERKAA